MQNFNTVDNYKKGVILTLTCYTIWGFFPLYWYPLAGMDSLQLMAQRIGWALFFISFLLCFRKEDRALLKDALTNRRVIITFIGSSFFLFLNWSVYLYAISSHQVLEASLGYYINPLVSILLGMIIFKEKLTKAQILAIAIAGIGILWLAFLGGKIPYIAIILAFSFGFYAAIKKVASLPPLPGIFLETLFMFPFTAIYLTLAHQKGELLFLDLPTLAIVILLLSGAATTIPLLLFAKGAKYIPLSIVGILQYISPTFQFLLGLIVFNEVFSVDRLVGFIIVWISVIIYISSEIHRIRRKKRLAQTQSQI